MHAKTHTHTLTRTHTNKHTQTKTRTHTHTSHTNILSDQVTQHSRESVFSGLFCAGLKTMIPLDRLELNLTPRFQPQWQFRVTVFFCVCVCVVFYFLLCISVHNSACQNSVFPPAPPRSNQIRLFNPCSVSLNSTTNLYVQLEPSAGRLIKD